MKCLAIIVVAGCLKFGFGVFFFSLNIFFLLRQGQREQKQVEEKEEEEEDNKM